MVFTFLEAIPSGKSTEVSLLLMIVEVSEVVLPSTMIGVERVIVVLDAAAA